MDLNNIPIVSFSVISDTHIDSDFTSNFSTNFKTALHDLNDINKNADALCIVGDITDTGSDTDYDNFLHIMNSIGHPDTYMILGNHDVRWLKGGYKEAYERYIKKTGMPGAYFDKWIKDYHFIFLSTDQGLKDEAYISKSQLDWLENKLAEKKDDNKFIFVFLHQSVKNSSAGSYPVNGYGTSGYPDGVIQDTELKNIIKKYPQIIFFTGHTHAVIDDPKSVINIEGIQYVNTASVAYTLASDGYGVDNSSQGLCVNVYDDKIIIKGRDFINKTWIPSAQWTINLPNR